jgi:hypothetical protein
MDTAHEENLREGTPPGKQILIYDGTQSSLNILNWTKYLLWANKYFT